jgi:3-oxoacyl-[acyl-carrier protein] reductase
MESSSSPRLVLVTGAAKGIGAATALAFAADGDQVFASDIDETGLEETARAVRDAGGDISTSVMDVRSTQSVNEVIARASSEFGRPFDVLVNNAGFASIGWLDEITDEHWNEVLNLNLMSLMRVTRAVAPGMRQARRGAIICLGSYSGHTIGWPGRLAYSSAKAGVTGLVRTLAMELAPDGIIVNGVAPAGLHAKREQVPLGYVGSPREIADFITLLASARARFMTGQMISVDGGMSVALC